MTAADWKLQRMTELRARIRIEESILRSLRAELEELQWLNRRDAELFFGWDIALSAEEQEAREFAEACTDVWLEGEHNLKSKGQAA